MSEIQKSLVECHEDARNVSIPLIKEQKAAEKYINPFEFDLSTCQHIRTDRWNVIDSLMHDIDQHSANSTYVFKSDEDDIVIRTIGQFVDDIHRSVFFKTTGETSSRASLYDRVIKQVRVLKNFPFDALQISAILSQDSSHATIRFHLFAETR